MKTYRVAAVICIAVLAALTVGMIITLIAANYDLFFAIGGVLVAALIVSYMVVKTFKNKYGKEKEDDGTSENG